MRLAEGDNYVIDLEDGVAVCRCFKRSDLDPATVAAAAEQLSGHARSFVVRGDVEGMVLDLRRVPGAVGPRVEAAYGALAEVWENTGQHLAVLVDEVVQRMQIARLLNERAPRCGGVFTNRDEARRFAGGKGEAPPTRSIDRASRVR